MTLSEIFEENDYRQATHRVVIGGDTIKSDGVAWDYTVGRVPTATISIPNPRPAFIQPFVPVRIYAGYDGIEVPVFTGIVLDPSQGETTSEVQCVGKSYFLEVAYQEILVEIDGVKTIPELIEELLVAAGITDYVVNITSTWVPGINTPQELKFRTYGEAIAKLAEAEIPGARWRELTTGQIRVEALDTIPGATVARQYFTSQLAGRVESIPAGVTNPDARPRIAQIRRQPHTREVKNYVIVRGTTIDQAQPDGAQLAVDVIGRADADSPWVRKADGSAQFNYLVFANEVFDDETQAGLKAAELVTLHNRLRTEVPMRTPLDPEIQVGQTVDLIDFDYTLSFGRWFVEGYKCQITRQDFFTDFDLVGGPQAGSQVNIHPFAQFTRTLEKELMANLDMSTGEYLVFTFDGRASFDLDGTIVSYAWSDNQGNIVTGTDAVVSGRIAPDAISGSWEVTLVVTDDQGATDTFTATIDTQIGGEGNFVGQIFVAFDTAASATANGGANWADDTAISDVISVAARPADGTRKGWGVWGLGDGSIRQHKHWLINTATNEVLAPVGSPIVDIQWRKTTAQVYAITQDGRVYWSQDDGQTWALYDDLRLVFAAPTMRLNRLMIENGALWVCGGIAGAPLIARDGSFSHGWSQVAIGGELATDLAAISDATLYVASIAQTRPNELAIIFNSTALTTAVYYTSNFQSASSWKRATGAPSLANGKWIERDYLVDQFALGYGDGDCYIGDVSGGVIAVSQAAATLDGDDVHNHGVWVGREVDGLAGTYIVSAEGTADGTIYKTWNRFGTVAKIRPVVGIVTAPAGANGKMTDIVGQGPEIPPGPEGPTPPTEPPLPPEDPDDPVEDPPLTLAKPRLAYAQRAAVAGDDDIKVTWRGLRQDDLSDVGETLNEVHNPWEIYTDGVGTTAVTVAAAAAAQDTILRCLSRDVWIIFVRPNTAQAPSSGSYPAYITSDAGQTWGSLGIVNVIDATAAPNGDFWLIQSVRDGASQYSTAVYRSTNSGASWSLSTTFQAAAIGSFRIGVSIAVHKLDSLRIAVWGEAFGTDSSGGGRTMNQIGGGFLRLSNLAGGSWEEETGTIDGFGLPNFLSSASVSRQRMWRTGVGRFVIVYAGSAGVGIIKTSGDGGVAWSTAFSDGLATSDLRPAGMGNGFFACFAGDTAGGDDSRPLISRNDGVSWVRVGAEGWGDVAGSASPEGCTVDPDASIFYAYDPNKIWRYPIGVNLVDVYGWEDVTENFPTYTAAGNFDAMHHVPRPGRYGIGG